MSEPTLKQLSYLRLRTREVGENPLRPRTSAQASREVARLEIKAQVNQRVRGHLVRIAGRLSIVGNRTVFPTAERSSGTGTAVVVRFRI